MCVHGLCIVGFAKDPERVPNTVDMQVSHLLMFVQSLDCSACWLEHILVITAQGLKGNK
jgi:hypothetical protein